MAYSVSRDEASAPFFEAAAEGRLLIRRCPVCGTAYAPHTLRCADSDALSWQTATGSGLIVTWAVGHSDPLDPVLASPGGSTYLFGLIELREGPWLQAPIVGVEPSRVRQGMQVSVLFVRPGGEEAIPVFAPART
jgi:uncharacterized OB-fold protein